MSLDTVVSTFSGWGSAAWSLVPSFGPKPQVQDESLPEPVPSDPRDPKVQKAALKAFGEIQKAHDTQLGEFEEILKRITKAKTQIHTRNEKLYESDHPTPELTELKAERQEKARDLLDIQTRYQAKKDLLKRMEEILAALNALYTPLADRIILQNISILGGEENNTAKAVTTLVDALRGKIEQLGKMIAAFQEIQRQCLFSKLRDHTFGKFCCFVEALDKGLDPKNTGIQWLDKVGRYWSTLSSKPFNLENIIAQGGGDESQLS